MRGSEDGEELRIAAPKQLVQGLGCRLLRAWPNTAPHPLTSPWGPLCWPAGRHEPVPRELLKEAQHMSRFAVAAYGLQSAVWAKGRWARCIALGTVSMFSAAPSFQFLVSPVAAACRQCMPNPAGSPPALEEGRRAATLLAIAGQPLPGNHFLFMIGKPARCKQQHVNMIQSAPAPLPSGAGAQ